MKGLYIHIPFCRQACRYCDFHFTVSLKYIDEFVDCLIREIELYGGRGPGKLETLYVGGGTPSLLSAKQLEKILTAVHSQFTFMEQAEWTIECNPEDLDHLTLSQMKRLGFNRLSIGVQSFIDRDLNLMRRSHNATRAIRSVEEAAAIGFGNITIDLIYGIPGQTPAEWSKNLKRAISLPISHLSAYHLTFEPGTVFDHWRKKGRILPVHEEESIQCFTLLREAMRSHGFEHYEISNFAAGGRRSRHNMIYWNGKPYQGLGPSAHSYDGTARSWNRASLKSYMDGIREGEPSREIEQLSPVEQYHDYLITSLRTSTGADTEHIREQFGVKIWDHFRRNSEKMIREGTLEHTDHRIVIRPDSWLITDLVLKELFLD